jgi:hypothetical protein
LIGKGTQSYGTGFGQGEGVRKDVMDEGRRSVGGGVETTGVDAIDRALELSPSNGGTKGVIDILDIRWGSRNGNGNVGAKR